MDGHRASRVAGWAARLMRFASSGRRPLVMTLASSGVFQATSIMTGVVLARALGPADRGELGTIVLWPSVLAGVVILGIPEAISVLTAARALRTGDALRSALPIVGLLAAIGMAGAAAIESVVITEMAPTSMFAAVLYLAFIPLNLTTLSLVGALSGNRQFGALNAVRLSVVFVAVVVLPLLAIIGKLTVLTAVITYLTANVIALTLAACLALRRSDSRHGVATRQTARRLLSFGARSHAGMLAGLLSERLDQLAISTILPPVQFGLYLAAVTLGAGAGLITSAITTVLTPTIASMEPTFRLVAARRYLRIVALLVFGYALVMVVLAPFVLRIFFGPEFEAAGLVAQIVVAGTLPLSLSRSLAASSRACGQPGRASRAEWLGLALGVPAFLLLIPAFGLIGAASASVIAHSASLGFQARVASSALGARSMFDLVRRGHWEGLSVGDHGRQSS